MKILIAMVVFSFSIAGCKQGLGERCQVDSDCAQGNCSKAEPKVCGGEDSEQLDANLPVLIDAGIDAAIDAPIDAAADAPP